MAIKLCKLFDLKTIVTCGSDDKCAAALDIGATHAINYKSHDFVEEVQRLTDGKGVEIVLDMVGGSYLPRNMACLADDGRNRVVVFAHSAGSEFVRRLKLPAIVLGSKPTPTAILQIRGRHDTLIPLQEGDIVVEGARLGLGINRGFLGCADTCFKTADD